jgi:hypothetical protein
MAVRHPERNKRLAEALKRNLKRRKASGVTKKTEAKTPAKAPGVGRGAGIAPQQGLDTSPSARPKTAPKRN